MFNIGLSLRVGLWPRGTSFWVLLCLLALSFCPAANTQVTGPIAISPRNPPSQPESAGAQVKPLRVDVNLVLVPVVVTDPMNHPITGLGKEDFALYENDEQREIEYFYTEDSPISVGLLLDLSKSMTDKFDSERDAVSEFFKNANAQDDYFVVTFASHPQLLTEATQSIGTIQEQLASATPNGSTAMLDAISLAMKRMHSAQHKRRALLIISDGGDNSSHQRFRDIKRLVRDSDVEVYAIGLFDTTFFKTFEEFMGKQWLSEITDATGGRTLTVDSVTKMPEAAAAISRELRNQYVLGYRAAHVASDGKRRQIKVRVVKASPGTAQLQTSYKRGYLIPKVK